MTRMNISYALLFGIVEGITEFLPVSSTGHLILTAHVLGLGQTEFMKSFEIAIQLGAILAVVALYGKTFFKNPDIAKRVLTAFIPTAVVGLVLYKTIKKFLLGSDQIVLWALLIGGIFLIGFEWIYSKIRKGGVPKNLSYQHAVLIGLCQSLAVVPGVSRSAATIVAGLALGLPRKTIVEFSFLLAVPTMLAAAGLDLAKNASGFSGDQFVFLAIGFAASFFVAVLSIRFLLLYIQKHSFVPFGIYRVLAALVFWFLR